MHCDGENSGALGLCLFVPMRIWSWSGFSAGSWLWFWFLLHKAFSAYFFLPHALYQSQWESQGSLALYILNKYEANIECITIVVV